MDKRIALLALGLLLPGCEEQKPADTGGAAECATIGDLGARSLKKWNQLNEAGPPEDAPVDAIAKHTVSLGKAALEIGEAFGKTAPKRTDLAESAAGVRMLGDLAGKKLEAFGQTIGDLAPRLSAIGDQEAAAGKESAAMGKDIARTVGCEKASKECADVTARLDDVKGAGSMMGFEHGAATARTRADALDGLAKAVEALPASPPLQKAREDMAKHARAAAVAFRAMAKAFDEAAPLKARLDTEREDASKAAMRFVQELDAASKLCAPKGAPTGSAPAGSAKPAASH
jgi:hypothetical protein